MLHYDKSDTDVTIYFVDWSEEQLRKHADEIRNSLGNYFLRVTSNTIKRRATSVTAGFSDALMFRNLLSRQFPKLDFSNASTNPLDLETYKLSTNEELLTLLDHLGARVSRSMRNFEVADALHSIVLILRHVRFLGSHLATFLSDDLIGEWPLDNSPTLVGCASARGRLVVLPCRF